MKKNLLASLVILFTANMFGQNLDTIYFDSDHHLTESLNYDYKRVVSKVSENKYLVKDYYASGSLKSECTCLAKGKYQAITADFVKLDASKKVRLQGHYVSYYRSGGKKQESTYKKGKRLDNTVNYMENGDTIFYMVDNMPKYPGGEDKLRKFIANELNYPEDARQQRIQGMVFISFIVNKSGNVQYVSVARGVDARLDQEALRVVESIGKWIPGTNNGKPENVAYTVPINFVLQ